MKITKNEIIHSNGLNRFNLIDENNLILGVVAGFSNDINKKNATLFENAPEMLNVLKELM